MKIGIYTGCFNPVHNIHLEIVKEMIDKYNFSEIYIVPCGDRYPKKDLIKFKHRYKMLDIALNNIIKNNNYYKDKIHLSDYENTKLSLKYTYQTLDHFNAIYNMNNEGEIIELYFITGADNFLDIRKWMEYEYMLANYNFTIIDRGNKKDDINKLIDDLNEKELKLDKIGLKDIEIIAICENDLSSTLIRNELKSNNELNNNMLDKDVLDYIKQNNLYIK